MVLTLNKLFNDPTITKAIIDRIQALKLDVIFWKRHLDFEETKSRVFKTYLGSVTGVTAGSIIDRNSNKPLRERRTLGSGVGEVAYLGDRYQMDNDRLDMLQSLVDKFNATKTSEQSQALNEIITYITDDMRQVLLAPHKRMDLVLGSLRSDGQALVNLADNPQGASALDISLPVTRLTPETSEKKNFMGNANVMLGAGLITEDMASQVFTGIGLPKVRINEDLVEGADGKMKQVFKDNRISLFQEEKIGKMKWHTPYEILDPIPDKVYTRGEGGMYISNVRTDEGRFMEYGAEWIPDVNPNKMAIIDLDKMNA